MFVADGFEVGRRRDVESDAVDEVRQRPAHAVWIALGANVSYRRSVVRDDGLSVGEPMESGGYGVLFFKEAPALFGCRIFEKCVDYFLEASSKAFFADIGWLVRIHFIERAVVE